MAHEDSGSTVTVDGAPPGASNGDGTSTINRSFPWSDLQPRQDTQAHEFVTNHQEHDGRHVRIGILDTGIFPTAHGIQYMEDGVTPKLLHVVDCTGSGDVDVSARIQAELFESASGESWWQLTSPLTGRVLKISADWPIQDFPADTATDRDTTAISSEYTEHAKGGNMVGSVDHTQELSEELTASATKPRKAATFGVGVKRAYELFPRALIDRCKKERRTRFQHDIQEYVTDLRHRLAKLSSTPSKTTTWEQTQSRDDLQARLEALTSTTWSENDPGPLFDCLVWYDGLNYVAVINMDEVDNLVNKTPLISMEQNTLQQSKELFPALPRPYLMVEKCGIIDQMVLAINVYDHGKVLTLVADCTPHGTHVASIAAAADGERSGVAPGAQLIGLKIGDTRLGSMETGAALVRALSEAVRLKCDVVNLSYGEGTCVPNSGRIVELIDELVWKHNVLFISSAGNNGPALSTVGAPGGTTESALGVGAYVSPAMMRAEYSLPMSDEAESQFGNTFTWSSVGPTADGAVGVDVIAPGGAITSVSHWCLQKSMLMNGTSMSSPHATGCAALLLSACKANGIPCSPARIKRAILNTAKVMPRLSPLQQGWGMIQVSAAWEYLLKHKDLMGEDVHFKTTVESERGKLRGVYLRQAGETSRVHAMSVHVDPQFQKEDEISENVQSRKIAFEMAFDVTCDVPWIKVPRNFVLMNNGRSFKIEIDPTKLPPGLFIGRVSGLDSTNPNRGVIFSLPVTVAKPLPTQRFHDFGQVLLNPAETKRFFVTPPQGSTWMDVTVKDYRDSDDASPRLVVLHVVQLLPHAAYRHFEKQRYLTCLAKQHTVTSVSVEEGVTVEIAVARYWSTIGDTRVSVTAEFRGVRPAPSNVTLSSGSGGALVRLFSDIGEERVAPNAKLSKWRTPVRPNSAIAVVPLTDRDLLPSRGRRIYELVMTYDFTQDEKGSVTPVAPTLQGVLYESALESQLMLFFDGDKKYLGASDAFPSAISLPKGPITMRLQLRHEDPKILESLKDMTVWFERNLEKEITLSAYDSKERMVCANDPFKKRLLCQGESVSVYIGNPPLSKIPSSCKAGDMLLGSITYESGESSLSGDGKRPGGFPVTFLVGPKPEKQAADSDSSEPKDERSTKEKMDEAVRELQISYLGKLTPEEKEAGKFDELYRELDSHYPGDLHIALFKLKHLDSHDKRQDMLHDIVSASDAVVALIDEDALALHFGRKTDSEDPVAVKERKDMKDKRSILTEALARKALAYWDIGSETSLLKFDETLKHLRQWMDVDSNDRFASVVLAREERAGRYGLILKLLEKSLGKETVKDAIRSMSKKDLLEKRIFVLERLGYAPLVEYERRTRVISFRKSFAPF